MDTHSAHIAVSAGWGRAAPIVLRVYADEILNDRTPTLVEIPLGLDWNATRGSAPAWTALARRADIALAQLGYSRTVDWQHHVYPQPLAATTISRSAPSP